jgi:hypothetical protein
MHKISQPGPGDIWGYLSKESNGFVGVASDRFELTTRTKFPWLWKKFTDKNVVREIIINLIYKVVTDSQTRLLHADFSASSSQYVVVSGNVKLEDFHAAKDRCLLPKNIHLIYAPNNFKHITITRFSPLRGRIQSVERIWKIRSKGQSNSYSLPSWITEKALESVWEVASKTADHLGISPEQLLEGD